MRLGPSGERKTRPQQYHESVAPTNAQRLQLNQAAGWRAMLLLLRSRPAPPCSSCSSSGSGSFRSTMMDGKGSGWSSASPPRLWLLRPLALRARSVPRELWFDVHDPVRRRRFGAGGALPAGVRRCSRSQASMVELPLCVGDWDGKWASVGSGDSGQVGRIDW